MSFTLGPDYGTNSARALIVRCADGKEFGSCVVNYPSGHQGILLDAKNHPLAAQKKFAKNLNAHCWLWKDHTSWREADKITQLAAKHNPEYIAKCGDTYSSEWFWAKLWHCLNVDPKVFNAAYSWMELCDWLPAVLAGITHPKDVRRGICTAGHKALYCDEWGGLPSKKFLRRLYPKLAALRDRLYEEAHNAAVMLAIPLAIPLAASPPNSATKVG
jgi:L-ribulokinase